jgi:hypothetical protein
MYPYLTKVASPMTRLYNHMEDHRNRNLDLGYRRTEGGPCEIARKSCDEEGSFLSFLHKEQRVFGKATSQGGGGAQGQCIEVEQRGKKVWWKRY